MKKIIALLIVFFPWKIKRFLLIKIWKYDIHPTAKIGLSYIYPKKLTMAKGSQIDNFTVAIHLDAVILGENSSIGRSNWLTGFPKTLNSDHFAHQKNRKCELVLGRETAITKKHHLDCTNQIKIGDFTTVAGYHSQFLTHSINVYENMQDSHPISIGDYCFVGTGCVILGGAELPSFSVLGAKSLLNKKFNDSFMLYGGTPATGVKTIDKGAKYFHRSEGFVN